MELPKRKPNRLVGYDYCQNGAYFITACTNGKKPLFWVVGARTARPNPAGFELSDLGKTVAQAIENISEHYDGVYVDKYVVMPNHIHLILVIDRDGRAMRAPTIYTVMNQMKGYASKAAGSPIWQKLFHDQIIRNEAEYQKIWQYIETNPQKWNEDCFFCQL